MCELCVCCSDLLVSGYSIWIYALASIWRLCAADCVDICCCVKITECDNMPSIIIIHRLAKHLSSSVSLRQRGSLELSYVYVASHRFFERCRKFPFMKIPYRAVFFFCCAIDNRLLIAVVFCVLMARLVWRVRVTIFRNDWLLSTTTDIVVGIQITWEI